MFREIYIIAEVGQAHDGSLGLLHSYIDVVSKTGANAIKFQMHYADAESSDLEKFRVNFSYEDKTRYDYWKRMELTFDQWAKIKEHCEEVNLDFIVSPFSIKAVDFLEQLKVKYYKIASGEIENYLMLEKISKTGKPLFISTGMSSYDEINSTLNILDKFEASKKRVLFQCTTSYPTSPETLGLNVIKELKKRFNYDVGLSDHSGHIYPSIASACFDVKAIEAHIVFDKSMFGPDSNSSLTPINFTEMVDGVRYIEKSLKNPIEKNDLNFDDMKIMFGKALSVNKNKFVGDIISIDDLESKKPADAGIKAKDFESIVGKKLKYQLFKGDFITYENIENEK